MLLNTTRANGVGAIGVRVPAGGALTGTENCHPLGMPVVTPVGSIPIMPLMCGAGLHSRRWSRPASAASLTELAIRYVISNPALPTTEIGIATIENFNTPQPQLIRGHCRTKRSSRSRPPGRFTFMRLDGAQRHHSHHAHIIKRITVTGIEPVAPFDD